MLGIVAAAWVLSRIARQRGSDLRQGLLLIFFGLGLGASEEAHGLWTLALVPLFVGVGYVVASHWPRPSASSRR